MNFKELRSVAFPDSNYININMMPFIQGNKDSIPPEYQQYWDMIEACAVEKEEHGKVGYLTITETYVPKGVAQRRPGVHTDGHCCPASDPRFKAMGVPASGMWGWGGGGTGWGKGKCVMEGDGTLHVKGIYMASNIANTTRIYDDSLDQTGWMGDCEECEDILARVKSKPFVDCKENHLYWMTDRTPHECLPMPESGHRQFFRLVTSAVDIWYIKHSTPNRLGIEAPCMKYSEKKFFPKNSC